MPTPGPIRKEILNALENTILPALWERKVPIAYITPALEFPAGITVRRLESTVPRAQTKDVDYPLHTHWLRANLHSSHLPYFGLIYEGIVDVRTLITTAQAAQNHSTKGIYAIRLHAPAMVIYPPRCPRDGGNVDFWQDPDTPRAEMRSLWGSHHSELGELLLHTHVRSSQGQRTISHSLQINDPATIMLTNLLMQAMSKGTSEKQSYAHSLLLAGMLRIQEVLRAGQPQVANTSRTPIPLSQTQIEGEGTTEICRTCAIYIHMHLHEPLTLTQIARQARLSPTHLNRLFQQHYGTTVMRYVRDQRIVAAQRILKDGPENISEIASLVGFKRVTAFCDVFRLKTGLTPNQYRRREHRKEASSDDNVGNSE